MSVVHPAPVVIHQSSSTCIAEQAGVILTCKWCRRVSKCHLVVIV
jgi:hypothetical protein